MNADEPIPIQALNQYLQQHAPEMGEVKSITRFTGGYSNLTYCLETSDQEFVLRMPPPGANIKAAHDKSGKASGGAKG